MSEMTDEALREEVRAWLAENWKGLPQRRKLAAISRPSKKPQAASAA